MTLCPIAIAVGCKKCPVFKICPLKSLVGDMPPVPEAQAKSASSGTRAKTRTAAKSRTAAARKKK